MYFVSLKTIYDDGESEYMKQTCCKNRYQKAWPKILRLEPKPITYNGNFSDANMDAWTHLALGKEHTPADEAVAVIGGKAVSEEKKLSHDKKRKSIVLSPDNVSSMKKNKEKKKNNNNNNNKDKEETKIEMKTAKTLIAMIEHSVNEKMLYFETQLKNLEQLIRLHMNEDNKDVPVIVDVDSDGKSPVQEHEKEEQTKIEKISCSTMFTLIDCFVDEKMLSFDLQLRNMERLINLHMNKDNKVVPNVL